MLSSTDILEAVHTHWGIENKVHWVLDVVFDEDANRARMGHAPQNLATMRRIAINMLNQEKHAKIVSKASVKWLVKMNLTWNG